MLNEFPETVPLSPHPLSAASDLQFRNEYETERGKAEAKKTKGETGRVKPD